MTSLFGRDLPLSMMTAGLNGLTWLWFLGTYVAATWRLHDHPRTPRQLRATLPWLDVAALLLAASTLGIAGLAGVGMSGLGDPRLTTALVDFFLALFGEGWFTAALLGLAFAARHQSRPRGCGIRRRSGRASRHRRGRRVGDSGPRAQQPRRPRADAALDPGARVPRAQGRRRDRARQPGRRGMDVGREPAGAAPARVPSGGREHWPRGRRDAGPAVMAERSAPAARRPLARAPVRGGHARADDGGPGRRRPLRRGAGPSRPGVGASRHSAGASAVGSLGRSAGRRYGAPWGWAFPVAVLVLLAGLVPLTGLWPAEWRGLWTLWVAAFTSLALVAAAAGLLASDWLPASAAGAPRRDAAR